MGPIHLFAPVVASGMLALAYTNGTHAAPVCHERYIRMVIPQPAGGVGDMLGRLLGDKASSVLGQQMVIENIPGATTTIGTAAVAKAKPDGCTILHLATSGLVASVMRNDLPYNLDRDFIVVIGVGSFPLALSVRENSKIKTFSDLVAATKSPDGVNYSTGGPGTMAHLAALQLLKAVGGKGTHIPFKVNAPALQSLMAGDVDFMFPATSEALPLMGSKLRVLALTSEKPLPIFPNVPTMKDLGFADFAPRLWYAFLVPKGTPAETVARIQDAFAKAISDPSVQEQLRAQGYTTDVKSSAEMSAFIKGEAARWKKVIQENNITSSD
jgi:tripartite-type tricarboxylate transporter receptor subunit TctC